nr:zinc finger BED domain-containing protein RICESLEEPER 2-like [Ipomoea trifida]
MVVVDWWLWRLWSGGFGGGGGLVASAVVKTGGFGADRTPPAARLHSPRLPISPRSLAVPLPSAADCSSALSKPTEERSRRCRHLRGLEGMEDDVGKDVGREVEEVEGDCEPYKKKQRKQSSVIWQEMTVLWNATFAMLSSALDFKQVFPRYQLRDPNYKCLPFEDDCQKVEEICPLLVHFNEVIKTISVIYSEHEATRHIAIVRDALDGLYRIHLDKHATISNQSMDNDSQARNTSEKRCYS